MSHYPCTQLISSNSIVIAIYGPYIHVVDAEYDASLSKHADKIDTHTRSGKLLQSNSPSESSTHTTISVASAIRSAAVSLVEQRLVTVDDEKQLKVWDLTNLNVLSSRELPKKASQVLLTEDGQTILVADKFGDVFSYPIIAPDIPLPPPKVNKHNQDGRKSLASHENPSLGTLILGHTSSLISVLLSPDGRFILTSDRDEHIRISHYPRGYNIERYCLGHTKYVSALHIAKHAPSILISAGGDRHLFFWNYLTGNLENKLEIWDAVHSMTQVASQRRKFKRLEAKAGTGWRARRREEQKLKEEQERKQRELARQGSGLTEGSKAPEEDEEMEVNVDAAIETNVTPAMDEWGGINTPGGILINRTRANLPSLDDVIVVHKIDTLRIKSQYALIFSAVGANAVFFVPYDPSSSRPSNDQIYHYTLPSPVLDFAVMCEEDGDIRNRLWVSVDTSFQNVEEENGNISSSTAKQLSNPTNAELAVMSEIKPSTNAVHLLEWRGNDTVNIRYSFTRTFPGKVTDTYLMRCRQTRLKIIEVMTESEPVLRTLLNLRNIDASTADLRALDLYALLTTLPKTEELEEPDTAERPHDLDVSMDNSVALSLDEQAGRHEGEQTASGQATMIGHRIEGGEQFGQKRAVKKDGRKKWQAKMEMRTKAKDPDDIDNATTAKDNGDWDMLLPSPAASTAKEGIPMETEVNVRHDGDALQMEGGKRKTIEKDNAEYSDGHISKRLKTDVPR